MSRSDQLKRQYFSTDLESQHNFPSLNFVSLRHSALNHSQGVETPTEADHAITEKESDQLKIQELIEENQRLKAVLAKLNAVPKEDVEC